MINNKLGTTLIKVSTKKRVSHKLNITRKMNIFKKSNSTKLHPSLCQRFKGMNPLQTRPPCPSKSNNRELLLPWIRKQPGYLKVKIPLRIYQVSIHSLIQMKLFKPSKIRIGSHPMIQVLYFQLMLMIQISSQYSSDLAILCKTIVS